MKLQGYLRADGRKGVRNVLVVAYLVECAHHVAREIASPFRERGVHLIGFPGCYPNAYSLGMMEKLCTHPNVGAALLVSLGCEGFDKRRLARTIEASGRPVSTIGIQDKGGTRRAMAAGREWVEATLADIARQQPVPMGIDELTVGTICGGSDATSGLTANPAMGVAFDLLVADGRSLTALPWSERRKALEALIPARRTGAVRRGESVRCGSAAARKLFDRARAEGWEGVLLKRVDAPYQAGRRTPDWRKVKLEREQEFVIGGFTAPTQGAARDHLGALLVGYYDASDRLRYAGKVGTGYTASMLALLARKLAPLRRAASPFVDAPRSSMGKTTWVTPVLDAQVRYNEITEAGILRQPSFLGLRDDKAAHDVRLESTESAANAVANGLRCAS